MNTKKQTQENKVQNLTLTFVQDSTVVNIDFEVNHDVNDNLLIGSSINELFTIQSNYKEAGITLFKATEPVLFKVSNDKETILDIGKVSKKIQQKLKFGNTAKSRRTFAKRVNVAVREIRRNFVVMNYDELTEKLNAIQD
jgi:hypothetical protein